jgi:hypothetical protein
MLSSLGDTEKHSDDVDEPVACSCTLTCCYQKLNDGPIELRKLEYHGLYVRDLSNREVKHFKTIYSIDKYRFKHWRKRNNIETYWLSDSVNQYESWYQSQNKLVESMLMLKNLVTRKK